MNIIGTELVKDNSIIQGGSFRLDKGPTKIERESFKYAVQLMKECKKEGKKIILGCMINDLAVKPEERPKKTGKLEWPTSYLKILKNARVPLSKIYVDYESKLRNEADGDRRKRGVKIARSKKGIPICRSIMGKFYDKLAKKGYRQQIGFYVNEPKNKSTNAQENEDNSCPFGPIDGAIERGSGYKLKIEIINFLVESNGKVSKPIKIEPE